MTISQVLLSLLTIFDDSMSLFDHLWCHIEPFWPSLTSYWAILIISQVIMTFLTWRCRANIGCNKSSCKYVQYIGETKRHLKKNFSDHCYYVKKSDLTQPIGFHFNLPGHSISNIELCMVEKCSQSSDLYRKQREEYFITKFNTRPKLDRKLSVIL